MRAIVQGDPGDAGTEGQILFVGEGGTLSQFDDIFWDEALGEFTSGVSLDALRDALGGVYRTIIGPHPGRFATAAAGTKYFAAIAAADLSASATGNGTAVVKVLTAADLAISGLSTKLRVVATIHVGAVGPAVTITVGLYPVTVGATTLTLGSVTAGSTVAFASPANGTLTSGNSGDFAIPADGRYALGYIVSGTPAAGCPLHVELQARNV